MRTCADKLTSRSPPQIDRPHTFKAHRRQTLLFTLKRDPPAENKQSARRKCWANVPAVQCLLYYKRFKGQERLAVIPLDKGMDDLLSAAWHLHQVLSKWPWGDGCRALTGRKELRNRILQHVDDWWIKISRKSNKQNKYQEVRCWLLYSLLTKSFTLSTRAVKTSVNFVKR